MKTAEIGAIVRYGGRLYEVIGIGNGKHYILEALKDTPCPTCGRGIERLHLMEHAPLWQDNAEPVKTVEQ